MLYRSWKSYILPPSHPTHQVRYCRHRFSQICFVSSDHVRFLDTYFDRPLNFSVPQMSCRPAKKGRISRSKITSQFHVQCFLISLQSFKWSATFQTFMEPPRFVILFMGPRYQCCNYLRRATPLRHKCPNEGFSFHWILLTHHVGRSCSVSQFYPKLQWKKLQEISSRILHAIS